MLVIVLVVCACCVLIVCVEGLGFLYGFGCYLGVGLVWVVVYGLL